MRILTFARQFRGAPICRIVTVVSVFTGGTAALAYLAAWMIIPGEGEKTSIAHGIRGKKLNA
jgi:hypothetical protein